MDIVERISVGEQIGMLGVIFSKLSDQLAEQVQDQMDMFSSLIGPSVLIVVMVGVGAVLLGIVLPLMQMDSLVNF